MQIFQGLQIPDFQLQIEPAGLVAQVLQLQARGTCQQRRDARQQDTEIGIGTGGGLFQLPQAAAHLAAGIDEPFNVGKCLAEDLLDTLRQLPVLLLQ